MDELPITKRLLSTHPDLSGDAYWKEIYTERRKAAALIRAQHEALESVMAYARTLRKSSELVGPREYQDQPKLYRVWAKANYHAGKDIMKRLGAALAKAREA